MFLYFKFGAEKDMLDLLQNGTIYCNPLSFFAREDQSGRYDTDELVVFVETKFDGETAVPNELGIKMKIYSTQTKDVVLEPTGNLYCLYSLGIENVPVNSYHIFDQKMSDFGTHVIIIKDSAQFMQRVVSKVNEDGIVNYRDFVKYVSMRDFQGPKDFFTKDLSYRHQKEYRIYLDTDFTEPYRFSIGSISDIAVIEEAGNIKEFSMSKGQLLVHLIRPSKYGD